MKPFTATVVAEALREYGYSEAKAEQVSAVDEDGTVRWRQSLVTFESLGKRIVLEVHEAPEVVTAA